ncbi:MAG: hypothetical protein LAT64_10390 [Phycisphaerales bacterium]|nr:hypothetical protein [Planctomycetota bacterium]MCH8509159.1 hypothetical protein [Phycisphaerales bacterium]
MRQDRPRRPIRSAIVLILAAGAGVSWAHDGHDCALHGHPAVVAPGIEMVHACWPDEHGNLTGTLVPLETLTPENIALHHELKVDRFRDGSPARLDIVFVGDGYTASEMNLYHSHVASIVSDMFVYEPMTTYRPYFRIQAVEVISNESGVSNDPSPGITRDTALQMRYWCSGVERLLCVNVNRARIAARNGVDTPVDQIIAIANSTKYGGAGYPASNLGTAAGGNSAATQIVIHELGHSMGNLADEYTYGGPSHYTGSELGPANVTIFNASQMAQQERKWFRWLGANLPGFDGTVSAFEGGNYSETGVFRPTNNSMMRNLNRPFNLPSAERMILEIYREVSPIDEGTPTGIDLAGSDTVYVIPMQPDGHDLDIFWSVDGQPLSQLDGQTHVDLASLGFDDDIERLLSVTVVDPTPWVRDPAIRDQFLTETREWVVNRCINPADINGDGVLDFFDVSAFSIAFNMQDPVADFNGDGNFDFFDFAAFLLAFNYGCP